MLDLAELVEGWGRALPAELAGEGAATAFLGALAGALVAGAALHWARRAQLAGAAEAARRAARGGFSLRLEDGRLRAAGRPGRRFLGADGLEAERLCARLTPVEGPADPRRALRDLEIEGRAFRLLADDDQGRSWEVSGAPEAGEARLNFAPAGPARREIARLRALLQQAQAERDAARRILDAAPVAAWRRDAAGRVRWGNRLYRALAGAGDSGPDAPPPPLRLEAAASESGGAEGAPRPGTGRRALFDARDGARRWFEFHEAPAPLAGSAPTDPAGGEDALGFAIDASAAVHAEGALRRFVETLTETFAHLSIGLAIFDRETRLGLFNPAFAELMRLEPAWLAGRPTLSEVLANLRENRRMPDPEDFQAWRRDLTELFGEPGDGAAARPERTEIWHLPGEEQIRVLARPHPQGAVAFLFEDVSETARLERRWLTETEIRRAVMDRLEEGVAAFGPDGEARFANPAFAAIWGFRPGVDDDAPRLADALAAFREGGAPETAEAWDRLADFCARSGPRTPWSEELALRDGRRLRARVAALPDGSVLTAFSDVTDAARAAEAGRELSAALAAAEELREALVDQVSRRVRTPLNTLFGYGQMLADGAGPEAPTPRQARHAQGILSAAGEIQEAMSGLADLASAQEGALTLSAVPVNLRAALASALDLARRAAHERGVALSLRGGPGAEEVAGDAARLRQLLFNLIVDAVHRAPPGTEVQAGAARRGDRVEVWTDEPAPEADAAAPGAPGAPAAAGAQGPPELRGLAHALVRRFAELHGGEVRLERRSGLEPRAGAAPGTVPGIVPGTKPGAAAEAAPAAMAGVWRDRPLPFEGAPDRGPRLRVICALPMTALHAAGPGEGDATGGDGSAEGGARTPDGPRRARA